MELDYKNMSTEHLVDLYWDNIFGDCGYDSQVVNGCWRELWSRGIDVDTYKGEEGE